LSPYADTNAADFVTEIDTIDGLDETAADGAANADEQLTISLTNDEAAFEEALAPASMTFDTDVGQAQHDYRQAMALADYNLAVETAADDPDAQADYGAAVAAAKTAEQAGYDKAYVDFAAPMMPAITTQGVGDAAAEFLESQTLDDENLTDIVENNQAVDGYQGQRKGQRKGVRNEWHCRRCNLMGANQFCFASRARRVARGSCINL
jgi:hypothetical protein